MNDMFATYEKRIKRARMIEDKLSKDLDGLKQRAAENEAGLKSQIAGLTEKAQESAGLSKKLRESRETIAGLSLKIRENEAKFTSESGRLRVGREEWRKAESRVRSEYKALREEFDRVRRSAALKHADLQDKVKLYLSEQAKLNDAYSLLSQATGFAESLRYLKEERGVVVPEDELEKAEADKARFQAQIDEMDVFDFSEEDLSLSLSALNPFGSNFEAVSERAALELHTPVTELLSTEEIVPPPTGLLPGDVEMAAHDEKTGEEAGTEAS